MEQQPKQQPGNGAVAAAHCGFCGWPLAAGTYQCANCSCLAGVRLAAEMPAALPYGAVGVAAPTYPPQGRQAAGGNTAGAPPLYGAALPTPVYARTATAPLSAPGKVGGIWLLLAGALPMAALSLFFFMALGQSLQGENALSAAIGFVSLALFTISPLVAGIRTLRRGKGKAAAVVSVLLPAALALVFFMMWLAEPLNANRAPMILFAVYTLLTLVGCILRFIKSKPPAASFR